MQQPLKHRLLLWSFSLIVILTGWGFNCPAFAQSSTAVDIFRTAYENRYTWDSNFPGFTANIAIKQNAETQKGQIRINPDLSVEITGIDRKDVLKTVSEQMQMMVTHRRYIPFELAHKQHIFTFGKPADDGAVLINQKGEGTPSFYQVKDKKVTQVNRFMGSVNVSVDLLTSDETPAGYLGRRYIATFKYVQTGDILEKLEFQESYEKIGDYYISTHQFVKSLQPESNNETDIQLTAIQLLSAKAG